MEDQFANELQLLCWKVISVRHSWKDKVNEALKTQFAFQLCDPYLAAMACNYLKTQGQKMSLTQFWAECVSMFGSHIKTSKVKAVTNSVSSAKLGIYVPKFHWRFNYNILHVARSYFSCGLVFNMQKMSVVLNCACS